MSTATDDNFVVQGMSSEPNDPRLFDDAELTMGGNGDLAQVTDIQSDVDLQLEFWNGNNYQMVPAAYNYGDDSGETVADAVASFEHNPSNGVIYSEIVQGSGNPCTACTIGQLYGSAQVATIAVSVTPTLSSGILSVWTPSSPESEASQTQFMYDAKILIYPGTYCVSVSDPSGKVFGTQTVAVSGGATLNVAMTSSTNSSAVIKSSANSCMSTVPIVTGPSSTTLPNVTFTRTFTFVAVCTAPCDVLFPGPLTLRLLRGQLAGGHSGCRGARGRIGDHSVRARAKYEPAGHTPRGEGGSRRGVVESGFVATRQSDLIALPHARARADLPPAKPVSRFSITCASAAALSWATGGAPSSRPGASCSATATTYTIFPKTSTIAASAISGQTYAGR